MVQSLMRQAEGNVQSGTTNAEELAAIREVIAGGVSSSMRAQAIPEPLVVQPGTATLDDLQLVLNHKGNVTVPLVDEALEHWRKGFGLR